MYSSFFILSENIRKIVNNPTHLNLKFSSGSYGRLDRLKMFVESLGLNPHEVLTKDAVAMSYRTVVDLESRKIEVLNRALKHAILKELRNAWKIEYIRLQSTETSRLPL